jgi:hypothetical protein
MQDTRLQGTILAGLGGAGCKAPLTNHDPNMIPSRVDFNKNRHRIEKKFCQGEAMQSTHGDFETFRRTGFRRA